MSRWCPGFRVLAGSALVLFLALAPVAVGMEVPFAPAASIDTGVDGAIGLALADLDGDGDLDAVGTAVTDGELAWWENAFGDGSAWTPRAIATSFAGAASAAVADLDGDGLPDVVAAARDDDDVAWFRNDGTPAVGVWVRFSIDDDFDGARAVAVADLDRDGVTDVLAAGDAAGELVWWRNDGTPTDDTTDDGSGNFWDQGLIAVAPGALSIAAADLDRDGFLDVVGGAGVDVGWFRNDGDPTDGGWTPRSIDEAFTDVRSVAVSDLDGDGDLDVLAAAGGTGDEVAWWENSGSPLDDTVDLGGGDYWLQHTVADAFDGAFSVRATDLDGDGDADLLAAANTADLVAWWENDGDPTDDTTDLGAGNFWTVHTFDEVIDGARSVVAGDLDGDGDLDVVAAAFSAGAFSWWENETIHRSASLPTEHQVATGDPPNGVLLADLDGDGDLDMVGGQGDLPDPFTWWENDGTPHDGGWVEHVIGDSFIPPEGLAAGDLDGDGDLDLVAGIGIVGIDLSWWENDGTPAVGTWTEHVLEEDAGIVRVVELADLDGDGDLDVVFAEAGEDLVGWFENDGTACSPACSWPERSIALAFANPYGLTVADLDGDGELDVAAQSAGDALLVWWENDGTPAGDVSWVEHGIDGGIGVLCPVVSADVDGDGDLDILSCPGSDSSLRWFANDGTPADDSSWAAQAQIVASPLTPSEVVVADLDGDGDVDVAAAISGNSTAEELFVAWWENTVGDGSTWLRHDLASEVDLAGLAIGDLDGDGKPDLATSDAMGEAVSWWPNEGGQFALATEDRSSGGILDGGSDDLLLVTAGHRGRAGDSTVELTTFELLFEESPGDALSTAEANALIDGFEIYRDDGDGDFDGGDDTLITTVSPLALTSGVQAVVLPGGVDVQLAVGASKSYFLVLATTVDASEQNPNTFRITHHTTSSSTARDLEGDVALELEHAADVSTGVISAQGDCFALTLSHTGAGSDPVPTPGQSAGCAAGEFVGGEVVSLQATADAGWQVAGWNGTDDDGSTATTNSVTMPAAAHTASVAYEFPDELIIDGEFLGGTEMREACIVIRAGDVPDIGTPGLSTTIGSDGDITLRAGQSVVFYDGFAVLAGGTLVVEIASPAPCS